MSNETGTDAVVRSAASVLGTVRRLAVGLLILAFVVGWTGFWAAAVEIHHVQGDLLSVLVTGAIGAAPAAAVLARTLSKSGLKARAGNVMDGVTPS